MIESFNLYTYVYYRFFCLFRSAQTITFGWSEKSQYSRASWFLGMCEVWLIGGFGALIGSYFRLDLSVEQPFIIVIPPAITLVLLHHYFFHRNDNAKEIVAKYDKLPKSTNRLGGWLVFFGVLLCGWGVINSFSMYGEVARGIS
jgi:hypothetical protein